MTKDKLSELNSIKWWHRIELEPGLYTPGEVHHGPDGSNYAEERFGLPSDLTGKSILDVGAWDGYFSFASEKRGASRILAVDVPLEKGGNWGATKGFKFAKDYLKSKVEFKECSVDNLESLGEKFDIVLQYGVLYHLENLIPALKSTFNVTKEYSLIETALLPPNMNNNPDLSLVAFLNGYSGDNSNYWYPNITAMNNMLNYVGYKKVEVIFDLSGIRATFKCYK